MSMAIVWQERGKNETKVREQCWNAEIKEISI